MNIQFRQALPGDLDAIWHLLQQAIARRKADGSNQWQDGYPNPGVMLHDISHDAAFVLTADEKIAGYVALYINDEPAYHDIVGEWLSTSDFVVFHRLAVADEFMGKGLAKQMFHFIEAYAAGKGISSIKADTNFDNHAMLHLFNTLGYTYCGEVFFRGSPRKAFEKIIG